MGKGKLPFLAPTSVDGQIDLANRGNRLEGEDEEEARVVLIPSAPYWRQLLWQLLNALRGSSSYHAGHWDSSFGRTLSWAM